MDEHAYFPPPSDAPTYDDDTSWAPLLDGEAYFTTLDDHLSRAKAGDAVFIAGLEVDPDVDLAGRLASHPDHGPLGRRLARLVTGGVDVRVLVAGRVLASSVPRSGFPFRANAVTAARMRELTVDGSREHPLSQRWLLDFSGALLGSNHQKNVVTYLDGELTAFVSGIDITADRWDSAPHDRMLLEGRRWGWHDVAVRLNGRGATRVWETFRQRWEETLTLPGEHWLRSPRDRRRLNPDDALPPPAPAPIVDPVPTPGTSVRVLRSTFPYKVDSRLSFRRRPWHSLPDEGQHEVYTTLVHAINAARRYVYLEDQYLEESVGGNEAFELYPFLRAAIVRGVKVILVGSGTRDPEDMDFSTKPINRSLNDDLREKIVTPLAEPERGNLAVWRIEHCTVHSKLMMIDDAFANIGSANMFSRSMSGVDSEMCAAVATTTDLVRDLRVQVWAEHLRTAVTDELRPSLENLDLALGIWRPEWLPADAPRGCWVDGATPAGFEPVERALAFVGP